MISMLRRVALPVLLTAAAGAGAEVLSSARDGFVIEHEIVLDAPPDEVYTTLTDGLRDWWDLSHSYSGKAENLSLQAYAGGCFCERLPDGGTVEHLRVVFAAPGKRLRLFGGLGPLQAMGASGTVDFDLQPVGEEQTRLRFRYVVSGYAPAGLGAMAEPVDGMWRGQLAGLKAHLARN